MPRLSVWTFRFAFVNFLLGFTIGGIILISKATSAFTAIWNLRSSHIELLTIGWIGQLALGTAFWMFPRFRKAPKRGKEIIAWFALILLNLGIASVLIGDISNQGVFFVLGKASEIFAGLAFAGLLWKRVKPTETGKIRGKQGG